MTRLARRLAVTALLALPAVCAAGLPASAATTSSTPTVAPAAGGWWACVAVQALNGALCLGDPLPNQLPLV